MVWILGMLAGLLLLLPASAGAQSPSPSPVPDPSPTGTPHVVFPWALGIATPHGQLIRYVRSAPGQFVRDIWIPPQPVVVEAMVALQPGAPKGSESGEPQARESGDPQVGAPPESGSAGTEPQYGRLRQTYMVPGYYVRETTVGFHYPERWVLDNAYTWRLLPAEFRSR